MPFPKSLPGGYRGRHRVRSPDGRRKQPVYVGALEEKLKDEDGDQEEENQKERKRRGEEKEGEEE